MKKKPQPRIPRDRRRDRPRELDPVELQRATGGDDDPHTFIDSGTIGTPP
jgi:hypothetical protein